MYSSVMSKWYSEAEERQNRIMDVAFGWLWGAVIAAAVMASKL
jgi:hypothetical protein